MYGVECLADEEEEVYQMSKASRACCASQSHGQFPNPERPVMMCMLSPQPVYLERRPLGILSAPAVAKTPPVHVSRDRAAQIKPNWGRYTSTWSSVVGAPRGIYRVETRSDRNRKPRDRPVLELPSESKNSPSRSNEAEPIRPG
ncbi:hypothetical protein J6590_005902 [Homalodisca vitripennis]|nr:hypothetical protein J6590_005902 [Homalodisca vitripennis]